jgi:hypothetical protein
MNDRILIFTLLALCPEMIVVAIDSTVRIRDFLYGTPQQ